jgi:hypothetical protein
MTVGAMFHEGFHLVERRQMMPEFQDLLKGHPKKI